MNRFRFSCMLLSMLLICMGAISPAYAETEVELLRREVRELKKTVDQLSQVVQQQSHRIEEVAGAGVPPSQEVEARTAVSPPLESQNPALAGTDLGKSAPEKAATVSPPRSTGPSEVDSLLSAVNNSPPVPGSQSRSVGLWKYPTGPSTAAKLLPDISVIGTFAGAYFTQDPIGEVGVDPNRTGFTFQELEIGLQSTIDPYFKYDAFLSFTEEGVEIEEAYFTTLAGPPRGMQFRGGKMRIPFGRQNPKHLHSWNFADNTLVNRDILGPDGLKEVGLEMAYLFPTPFFLQAQGTFTNGSGDTSFGGTRKEDFLYTGRVSSSFDITDDLTMLVGGSAGLGFNDSGPGNKTALFGGDLFLKWKPSAYTSLSWQTEYILRRMQFPGSLLSDGGLYSYVDYQFLKQYHLGFRYDQMGIPSGVYAQEYRFTPAFTFQPTEFSQIRAQYEFDKIRGQSASQAVILQFMFSMGVHGAHPF